MKTVDTTKTTLWLYETPYTKDYATYVIVYPDGECEWFIGNWKKGVAHLDSILTSNYHTFVDYL